MYIAVEASFSVLEGGKELEQARQSAVVRSMALAASYRYVVVDIQVKFGFF